MDARDSRLAIGRTARFPSGRFFSGWLPGGVLILMSALGLSAALLIRQFQAIQPNIEVVYGQPMWAMHASMHSYENGISGGGMMNADRGVAPSAEMAERFYDFGAVYDSQEVSRSFILANRGSAPLVISSAYSTCSCTRAEISAAVIPPGKAGLITVYFHPQKAVGAAAVRRGIILETNDPQQPSIELWVQAEVSKNKSNSGKE